ncbi:hypothetical protein GCM10010129_57700 [Streptomyces fumigatiscleroticus]|nr:hypothetical protein GCM10010129_57700 [Streptomyces fumigatiscleroticus]
MGRRGHPSRAARPRIRARRRPWTKAHLRRATMPSHLERYAQRHPHAAGLVLAPALCACMVFGAQISTTDSLPSGA